MVWLLLLKALYKRRYQWNNLFKEWKQNKVLCLFVCDDSLSLSLSLPTPSVPQFAPLLKQSMRLFPFPSHFYHMYSCLFYLIYCSCIVQSLRRYSRRLCKTAVLPTQREYPLTPFAAFPLKAHHASPPFLWFNRLCRFIDTILNNQERKWKFPLVTAQTCVWISNTIRP